MPVPAEQTPNSRGLLRDDVYFRLRDAIIDSTFLPGEQLRDLEIANWLGVSRTPVREALLRLGQAGLVVSEPGKSTIVASVDVKATRDAQAVVTAMYEVAIRSAMSSLTSRDISSMRNANERFASAIEIGDIEAAIVADVELHDVPVLRAANQAVAVVLEQFTPLLHRVARLKFTTAAGRSSIDLHNRLISFCETGDVDAAAGVSYEIWHSVDDLIDLAEDVSAKTNTSEQKVKN